MYLCSGSSASSILPNPATFGTKVDEGAKVHEALCTSAVLYSGPLPTIPAEAKVDKGTDTFVIVYFGPL